MKLIGYFIAIIFDTVDRNFNLNTFFVSLFSDTLDGFIYGSFFIAYYYFKRNKKDQQQLAMYHSALSESKIQQLKAQLNPHFLFNNLNVLDELIEEDKQKASDFLNEFAEIYRYVLQVSDKKLVSLNEEISFVKQYFRLIQHKYENAYSLSIEHNNSIGFIVPMTLQLVIENAIQHNLGTEENPVKIHLLVEEDICISNNITGKRKTKVPSSRSLKNLQDQYKLLTKKSINIQHSSNNFTVIIPIIYTNEYN